jgi:squalene-hopene/tetraprenyl-beta-curcumene cyclase
MPSPTVQERSEARLALVRAREHLLSLQDRAGFWQGELQSNVTMDAEDMLLREFLGVRTAAQTERSGAWIRSQQRADGTWPNFHGGAGDLSTTIEAYWALRLAGDPPDADHMRAAAGFIRERGGIERARVFTHVWLALFGLWPWENVPALPVELILLPASVPFNVYDFACWARQTIVALSMVRAYRPRHELPFALDELRGARPWRPREPRSARGRWLAHGDRLLRIYERRPLQWLRSLALARSERWIIARQEADGSWGGIQPPWVYSLMALRLRGYSIDHPVMRAGLAGIERFMVEERGVRRLEACQSPVWDTALAIVALRDAGIQSDHPALLRGAEWLLAEEVRARGDWARRRPELAPGGWAFEFANDNYPDVDDTAEVVLALLRVKAVPSGGAAPLADDGWRDERQLGVPAGLGPAADGRLKAAAAFTKRARRRPSTARAIERARCWVEGMQSADGGWGAFDADNTRTLLRELPFLDFGEVIDAPSADVTAHALEMLAALGLTATEPASRGLSWLRDAQERDGSWFGRWGVNHVYGTAAAVPALVAAGVAPSDPCIRRAVRWLCSHQNSDGGWGEDPRSYDDPAYIGRGPSTASQTAWALIALHAAGELSSAALRRGVDWLLATQRTDGSWDEPQYTGTGFPSDYYINYHLYRLIFPVMALGRCLRGDAVG